MPAPSLAFLENFYTGVTLHIPAEPAAPVAVETVVEAPAEVATAMSVAPPARVETAGAAVAPLAEPLAGNPAAPAVPTALPPPQSPADLTPFGTLGSNPHGVVLLVRLPAEQFLKLPRNVFLNKMLQALGLVMADVVLVNVESPLVVTLAGLRRELAATHIVAFGRDLLDVALRTTQIYEPVQFPNLGLSYLSSATVDSVEYDVSLKKRLWPGLQRMFL